MIDERARDRLANPPRRVGRELVAELVVELLDGTHQAEVPLLDEIEERNVGARVVASDGHDEAEVRLDQLLLRRLVAGVLAARELALLLAREQRPGADLANVELERIGGGNRIRARLHGGVGFHAFVIGWSIFSLEPWQSPNSGRTLEGTAQEDGENDTKTWAMAYVWNSWLQPLLE